MKANQRVIRSVGVTALALTLSITAVTSTRESVPSEERSVTALEKNGIAGVAVAMNEYGLEAASEIKQIVSIQREAVDVVAAPIEEEPAEVKAAVKKLPVEEPAEMEVIAKKTPVEEEWQDKLMADVDDFLYVRADADADSEIVGKMYKGHRALIREQGETWTEIESGNVKGYVKNEYCIFGMDAYKYAKKHCDTIVEVETNGLRIRSEADPDASVIKAVGKGDELVVDTKADEVDGWIAVEVDSQTCYVSSDYVTVKLDTGKAITMEEELAAIQAAEEAKAAKAAAAAASASSSSASSNSSGSSNGQTTSTSTASGTSLAASADEETLLAALVECEAGGCGVECMTAVAAVVINRVQSGSFPNTIYSVIYQRGQFGPASSGRLERRLANGVSSSARQAARAALAGSDPTGGAKYFKLASSGHAGVVIGPIVFY